MPHTPGVPRLPPPPLPVCILQGKIDPARRNYRTIFAEMLAHKDHLLAQNFSLTILGKGGGRRDSSIVEVPQELVDAGLLKQYASLPFQVSVGLPLASLRPCCRRTTAAEAVPPAATPAAAAAAARACPPAG